MRCGYVQIKEHLNSNQKRKEKKMKRELLAISLSSFTVPQYPTTLAEHVAYAIHPVTYNGDMHKMGAQNEATSPLQIPASISQTPARHGVQSVFLRLSASCSCLLCTAKPFNSPPPPPRITFPLPVHVAPSPFADPAIAWHSRELSLQAPPQASAATRSA